MRWENGNMEGEDERKRGLKSGNKRVKDKRRE